MGHFRLDVDELLDRAAHMARATGVMETSTARERLSTPIAEAPDQPSITSPFVEIGFALPKSAGRDPLLVLTINGAPIWFSLKLPLVAQAARACSDSS